MKRQMAAMMTGMVLAMSATTLPAFAKVSPTNTQPSMGAQQQKQVLRTPGARIQQQQWSVQTKKGMVSRLTPSERAKFKQFKAGIEQGLSPIAAANKVGSTKVTRLNSTNNRSQTSTKGQYQMRLSLSKKTSATIRVNGQTKVVKVVRVGSNVKRIQTLSQSTKARYQKRTTARYQKRTTAANQTRPSNRQTTSATLRVNGQTKVVKANPTGNNVKPIATSSQNQPVLPR
jgi:hypothetical protein